MKPRIHAENSILGKSYSRELIEYFSFLRENTTNTYGFGMIQKRKTDMEIGPNENN